MQKLIDNILCFFSGIGLGFSLGAFLIFTYLITKGELVW